MLFNNPRRGQLITRRPHGAATLLIDGETWQGNLVRLRFRFWNSREGVLVRDFSCLSRLFDIVV